MSYLSPKFLKWFGWPVVLLGLFVLLANNSQAAPSVSISVSPSTINKGSSAMLSWSGSFGLSGCSISNIGGVARTGSRTVSPSSTTTYTLTCKDSKGVSYSSSTTLTVNVPSTPPPPPPPPAPPTVSISVSPSTITQGSSANLSWSSSGASSCNISNIGSVQPNTFGATSVSPGSSTTYTISCSNSGGTSSASATLTVNRPPVTVDLKVDPDSGGPASAGDGPYSVVQGVTVRVYWSYRNADTCTASNWTGLSTAQDGSSGEVVNQTITYSLTCRQAYGSNVTDSVTVNAVPPLTADIKANGSDGPISINYNTAANLTWTSSNATSCSVTGEGKIWTGTSNSGQSTGNLTTNAIYTLTCSNAGGNVVDRVAINISIPPTLSVALNVSIPPPAGTNVVASADVSGTAGGTINYSFWWNCSNTSNSVSTVSGACGALTTPTAGSCSSNANGYKCNGVTADPQTATHTYSAGTYYSKVIVERSTATPAEARVAMTIIQPVAFSYTISNSGNITATKGSSGSNTITVSKTGGTAAAVTLSAAQVTGPLPTGVTASFSPASCTPNTTCTSTLTLTAASTATAGAYTIMVVGSPSSGTTSFTLTVANPVAAPTLSTVLTPTPTNGAGDTSVTLSATAGGTAVGTINYSFWWNCTNTSNSVSTVSGACGSLPAPSGGTCFANTNGYKCNGVTANPQVTSARIYIPGTYTSKVIVERGAATPAEARQTVTITAPIAFNYSLSNSGNITSVKGATGGSNIITVTKSAGTATAITLSASQADGPLPTGVTASFNPASCTPNTTCTSTLTLSASTSAVAGTYTIAVLGSPLGKVTGFYLVVSDPSSTLTASCTANKTRATLNESVIWSASATGPSGSYTYVWGGTAPLAGKTSSSANVTYTTVGNKTGNVTVTSGSKSATANCSNVVDVYAPAVKVTPTPVSIKVDDTRQLTADYYPYGLAIADGIKTVTANASWSSFNSSSVASVNNTNQKGLVKGLKVGTADIYANYTDPYGNLISTSVGNGTTAAVKVGPPESLVVSKTYPNSPGAILVDQNITFEATGGVAGDYKWSGGGVPAGSTSGQSQFTTKYSTLGSKTVTVTSGSQTNSVPFTVAYPILLIDSFAASPATKEIPLNTSLAVNTSSNIEATANYTFWWNCNNSSNSVSVVRGACGDPANSAFGAKFDAVPEKDKSASHTYSTSGNYTAKVIVERGGALPQEKRIPISTGMINIKAQAADGPVTLDADTSTSLSWTSENVTSCTASGTGPNWSGSKPTSGSDATGVLSQPATYRYTLTCSGANGLSISDYVDVIVSSSLKIDSFNVIPPGKSSTNNHLAASISSNLTGVTNNYTFYCNRPGLDSDTVVAGYSPDHKKDGVSAMTYQADYVCNYSATGTYTAKVIVERGGLARAAHYDIIIPANVAPAVSPIAPAAPANYCASPFGWVLKWNFSDGGGDSQYAYQAVIKDAANGATIKDTGQVVSSSSSYALPLGTLDFNKTYTWTIKVWESDTARLTTEATGGSFTTIKHAAPALSFNVSPLRPSKDEQVTLTDTTVVSGGATKTNWNWDLTGVDGVTLLSATNGSQAVVKFSTAGSKNVKLRVTDSDGLTCEKGANDDANDSLPNITIGRSIPQFREVLPR